MVEKSHAAGFWPSLYEPLRTVGNRVADWIAPASEASAAENAYAIALELPGVADKDVNVTVEDNVLTVKGEKRTSHEDKGETWYFSERQFGAFSRSFRLPPDADHEGVSASLKDGVLTVSVPKRVRKDVEAASRIRISTG
jgi:HSP20 family protein